MNLEALIKGLDIIDALLTSGLLTADSLSQVSNMMKAAHAENRGYTEAEEAQLDRMLDSALAANQAAIDRAKAAGRA